MSAFIYACPMPRGSREPRSSFHAQDYFPLKIGAAWTYRVTVDGVAAQGPLKTEVTDIEPGEPNAGGPVYVVSVVDESVPAEDRLDEPVLYAVRPDGIYCVKCEDYLLKEPVSVGSGWVGHALDASEASYRIVSASETVTVGGTAYQDCLVVEKTEPSLGRRIVTAYAPGLGPVDVRFWQVGEGVPMSPRREEILVWFRKESRRP